jgi:hypothetical protein
MAAVAGLLVGAFAAGLVTGLLWQGIVRFINEV